MKIRVAAVFTFLITSTLLLFSFSSRELLSEAQVSILTNAAATLPAPSPVSPVLTQLSKDVLSSRKLHLNLEIVTDGAVTGDGGNSWGGHQTRIVRTQDGVFTAYTVPGDGYTSREWRLAWRNDNGTWPVIAQGGAGREPVNLLASPDGTLNIIGWPNGTGTIWSGKPSNGTITMQSSSIPGVASGFWPYNSAGIDHLGNLCVLSSGGEQPGEFRWACYLPAETQWISGTTEIDYRYTYTYMFPRPDRGLSLVATRDVLWETLGYTKPEGAFDYVFNAFRYWRTDDMSTTPIQELTFLEEAPTTQFPEPYLNAQTDAYIDTKGQMHILYTREGASTGGKRQYRHRVVSPSGSLLYDVRIPKKAGEYSRIFQDDQEAFYLLTSSGRLYRAGNDGVNLRKTIILDMGGYQVEYSGFGISVPRTGTPLDNVLDVVFPSDNGAKWIYFRLDLPPIQK